MLQPRPPFPSGQMDLILGKTETYGALFLSGIEAALNPQLMQQNQIGAVLTVGTELSNLKFDCEQKLIMLHDTAYDPIRRHFEEAIHFIDEQRKTKNVLVHCFVGVSRSATLVIAYLMQMYNYSLQVALTFLIGRRPQINPNPGFMQQLQQFDFELNRRRQQRPASTQYVRSYNDRDRRESIEVRSTTRQFPNQSPLKRVNQKAMSTKSLFLTPKKSETQNYFNFTPTVKPNNPLEIKSVTQSAQNLDNCVLKQSNYYGNNTKKLVETAINGFKSASSFCKTFSNHFPMAKNQMLAQTQTLLKRTQGSGLGHRGRQPIRAQTKIEYNI
ncbi:unnamed protein product (macronuclear) [Paramecium tetraurelia]|uniref:protein-tyrosine-phosphatase n=1 Tax=Paramecium tetraurelia TaxID=5888 RepID=A0DG30_PARTE|nr:uncharacterized protein GSPATT00002125001 [Paramecium tetraurelia]CAK81997.1 unnamed protein product [Paramecium tetraurelia]|eukprot:XP_001449394.1 hypothetical protein (macronuclear) [Paramecium tetraurelia strain d4-2]